MKKILALAILVGSLMATPGTAYAANQVSQMAVKEGGQSVAQCAQMMDRGVSQCAKAQTCNMQ